MPRAPFQVSAALYRIQPDGDPEFAIFKCSNPPMWQLVAGGGEDAETPAQAVRREAFEEAGMPRDAAYVKLDTLSSVPVHHFANARKDWPVDLHVVPLHYFAADAAGLAIQLSSEHTEFQWATFAHAETLLRFDSDITALWELRERLKQQPPPPPEPRKRREPLGKRLDRTI